MEDLQIGIIGLMAVLEVGIILLAVTLFLALRSRALSARVRRLQAQLSQAGETPEPVTYVQYLRDEVLTNQALCESLQASDAKVAEQNAQLLAIRRHFLELEVSAQETGKEPDAFQQVLVEGLGALVEQWRPTADTGGNAESASPEPKAKHDADDSAGRDTIDTREQELARLKQVILNQHEAVSALRTVLQSGAPEIPEIEQLLQQLDALDKHDADFKQWLNQVETQSASDDSSGESGALLPLQDLKGRVGDQQDTLTSLHQLILELVPNAEQAAELETALQTIQRTNQELSGCIAVLEDENRLLRDELDAVNAQLDQAAEDTAPELTVIEDSAPSEEDGAEQQESLNVKIQELEALLEFKDAAIEELEKQYSTLEAKYLAATGEKSA